mgnify:CR=1 FL=1
MKRFYLLAALVLSLLWTSCTPHDSIDDFVPEYFVEELSIWDFTIGDAVSALLNELDIDQEDPTVSTIMNFLKIIRGAAGNGAAPGVAVATSDYHVFRSLLIARLYHLPASAVAAKSPAHSYSSRAREYIMFWHYVFRRLQMKLYRRQAAR